MSRKRGEPLDSIADVEAVSMRREPLNAITTDDVTAEGFPQMTSAEFIAYFCATHRDCSPATVIARIAWRYLNEPSDADDTR